MTFRVPKEEADVFRAVEDNGWHLVRKDSCGLMIYERMSEGGHQQINVWTSTGTVGTYLNHPKQGKTQLFRRGVSRKLLTKIFTNPRVHTHGKFIAYKKRPHYLSRTNQDKRPEGR